ncbi:hypothetical protein JL721_10052 [Aureococcus anophagefferens]|nr:hypothetical protein JL721_10052 [Aureococcus anophagefferens]
MTATIGRCVALLALCAALDDAPTSLELCPVDAFDESLRRLAPLLPGAADAYGGARNVTAYYAAHHGGTRCARAPSAQWPPSALPLLVNAGVGGTATTFVAKGLHSGQPLHDCTRRWDRPRPHFATDTPVAAQLYELLRTHGRNAVLLTLRDPRQWLPARLRKHAGERPEEWRVETPCAAAASRALGDAGAALDMLVYQAWAHCVASRQPWAGGDAARPVALLNLFSAAPRDVDATLRGFFLDAGVVDPASLGDGGACLARAKNDTALFRRLARTCLAFVKKGGWPKPKDFRC